MQNETVTLLINVIRVAGIDDFIIEELKRKKNGFHNHRNDKEDNKLENYNNINNENKNTNIINNHNHNDLDSDLHNEYKFVTKEKESENNNNPYKNNLVTKSRANMDIESKNKLKIYIEQLELTNGGICLIYLHRILNQDNVKKREEYHHTIDIVQNRNVCYPKDIQIWKTIIIT